MSDDDDQRREQLAACREVQAFAGVRVAQVRARLGRNQAELARALGVARPTAFKIEAGERALTAERLCQLALVLRVEPGSLLPSLDELPGMLGLGGLDELTKSSMPHGQDYLDAVATGASDYLAEHGKRPRIDGGDASEYVGFTTTWAAIDSALRRGNNGVMPAGGMHGFLDAQGIGKRRRRA